MPTAMTPPPLEESSLNKLVDFLLEKATAIKDGWEPPSSDLIPRSGELEKERKRMRKYGYIAGIRDVLNKINEILK